MIPLSRKGGSTVKFCGWNWNGVDWNLCVLKIEINLVSLSVVCQQGLKLLMSMTEKCWNVIEHRFLWAEKKNVISFTWKCCGWTILMVFESWEWFKLSFLFDAFIFSMRFSDTDSNNLIFSFGWFVETAFSLRLKDWN